MYTISIDLVNNGHKMRLSTRTRYGTRALLDLALHSGQGPVLLRDIARRQEISARYLEKLVAPLVGAGIVRSTRGSRGGVSLGRKPEDIRVSEVFGLLERAHSLVECVDDPSVCGRYSFCVTRDIWDEVDQAIHQVLDGYTLQDLVELHGAKMDLSKAIYHI